MCLDIVFLFDFGGFMMRVCIGFDDMFDRCIWWIWLIGESVVWSSWRWWVECIFILVKEILLELNEKKNGRLGIKNIMLIKI